MTKAEIWNVKADLNKLFDACKDAMEGEMFFYFSRRDILAELENVKNGTIKDASELEDYFSRDKRELLIMADSYIKRKEDNLLVAYVSDELREISEWYSEQIPTERKESVQSPESSEIESDTWDKDSLNDFHKFSSDSPLPTKSIQLFLAQEEIIPKNVDEEYFANVIRTGKYGKLFEKSEHKVIFARAMKMIGDKFFKGKLNVEGKSYIDVVCDSIGRKRKYLTSGGNCKNFMEEFKKII